MKATAGALSSSVEMITGTPARVDSGAETEARAAPPSAPASRQAGSSSTAGPGRYRATTAAAIPPSTSWPSPPRLYSPMRAGIAKASDMARMAVNEATA